MKDEYLGPTRLTKEKHKMRELGIIPARYASTRFPGKPLASIKGKPMIQWVYERSQEVLTEVIVATDDQRIFETVQGFGGKVVMTHSHHENGTSRCVEALKNYQRQSDQVVDAVINIQGDEPLVQQDQLKSLRDVILTSNSEGIATLAYRVSKPEELKSRHDAFVVMNQRQQALYFSRSPLPFVRDLDPENWLDEHPFYKHVGLYAFKVETLQKAVELPPSSIETAEKLEQNRWLDHGFSIRVELTEYPNISVDLPGDIAKVEAHLHSQTFHKGEI